MRSPKCNDEHRRNLIAAIHILEPKCFTNVQERKVWMQAEIGKSTCKDCSNEELMSVLKQMQDIADNKRKKWGLNELTQKQMAKLAILAREIGWDGINDVRLKNFIMRTLKLSDIRFANISTLSRENATAVITGLEKWLNNGVKRCRS